MKLVLGDNQFFGVNHANISKGAETRMLFDTTEKIKSFILDALACGLDGFMINSNETGFRLVDEFDFSRLDSRCHFSVPYPHKYAGVVNDAGIIALVSLVMRQLRWSDVWSAVKFLLTFNAKHLLPVIVQMEIPKSLPKGSVVYLQNVVTDLTMGLRNGDKLLSAYIRCIQKMGYTPGLITLNLGTLYAMLASEFASENIVVCFNVNKSGFNVFPSVKAVENNIQVIKDQTRWELMGMSIFSSGSEGVSIAESVDYIKSLPLAYVVFGSSKLKNIKANINSFHA